MERALAMFTSGDGMVCICKECQTHLFQHQKILMEIGTGDTVIYHLRKEDLINAQFGIKMWMANEEVDFGVLMEYTSSLVRHQIEVVSCEGCRTVFGIKFETLGASRLAIMKYELEFTTMLEAPEDATLASIVNTYFPNPQGGGDIASDQSSGNNEENPDSGINLTGTAASQHLRGRVCKCRRCDFHLFSMANLLVQCHLQNADISDVDLQNDNGQLYFLLQRYVVNVVRRDMTISKVDIVGWHATQELWCKNCGISLGKSYHHLRQMFNGTVGRIYVLRSDAVVGSDPDPDPNPNPGDGNDGDGHGGGGGSGSGSEPTVGDGGSEPTVGDGGCANDGGGGDGEPNSLLKMVS